MTDVVLYRKTAVPSKSTLFLAEAPVLKTTGSKVQKALNEIILTEYFKHGKEQQYGAARLFRSESLPCTTAITISQQFRCLRAG
jgi:hypothetical protein